LNINKQKAKGDMFYIISVKCNCFDKDTISLHNRAGIFREFYFNTKETKREGELFITQSFSVVHDGCFS